MTSATVPAISLPAGIYSVQVTDDTGYSVTLMHRLDRSSMARIGILKTNLIVPSEVGNHSPATIYVQYSNVGDGPLPAPILVLSASRPSGTDAFMTLDPNLEALGAWTSATPDGYSSSVEILAPAGHHGCS